MMRLWRVLAAAAVLTAITTACENQQLDRVREEAESQRSGAETSLESGPLPSLSLPNMSGDTVRLRDRLGEKATLVNFWATWCIPCREEMPALVETHSQFQSQGVQVVAVAVASPDTGQIRDWIQRYGMSFPVLRGMTGQDLLDLTGWDAVPTTLVVDGDGRVRHVMFGARNQTELTDVLRPLLDR